MGISIKRVETAGDLKVFAKFPFLLYKGNKNWVPPLLFDEINTLRKDRNPAFEDADAEYWLALRDGKPVGRIACIINRKAIAKWGTKNARFSWVDFVDDREVSSLLFETAEVWARTQDMEAIIGPMGFTDLDKEGMLIEGFDELGTMPMLYNHAYYRDHLEALGYAKDVDWIEFEIKVPDEIPEKIIRVNELVLKRSGLKLAEPKNRKDLVKKYGKQLFEIIDEAYAGLYGTVPLSPRQKDAYIDQYLGFIDLKYTKIIVDEHDRMIGFGITMPSLSRGLQKANGHIFPFGWYHLLHALKHPVGLDMYLIAVRNEYKSRGLIALILTEINRNAIADGIKFAESSGELESNGAVQGLWNHFEKRQHKRRRVFIKQLASSGRE